MAEYINRQEAKSLLHIEYAYAAEQLLDEIPAADVAPVVHGHWAEATDEMECSVCGARWNYCDNDTHTFNFCPNCGAKMDGGTENG